MATVNKKFVVKNGLTSEQGEVDLFGANTFTMHNGDDVASIVLDGSDGSIVIGANTSTNWELPTTRGTNGYFLKTNTDGVATWAAVPSGSFTISDGTNSDAFVNGETLTFTGGTGLTSAVSNNEVTFNLDNTGVSAGDYGNTTSIPVITVDAQGRITSANTASISTSFDITDGTITDTFNNGDTLTFTGGSNITSTVSNNEVTFALDDSVTLSGTFSVTDTTDSANAGSGAIITSGGIGVGKSLYVTDNIHGYSIDITNDATILGSLQLGAADANSSFTIKSSGSLTIDPYADGANGVVIIQGDLQVKGTTTTINSTTVEIGDLNLTLAKDATTSAEANGGGITIAGANATFNYASTGDKWVANKPIDANIIGDLTGNADTATKLQTARTIELTGDVTGSASFDGSANASIAVTIAANSVALGTDTTGDYVQSLVAGTGISLANNSGEGATPTITNADPGSAQFIFKQVDGDSGNTVVADSNDDTLTISGNGGLKTVASATTDTLVVHVSDTVTFGSDTTPNAQNVSIRGYQQTSITAATDYEVATTTNAVGSKLVFGAVDTADATSRHMIEVLVMTDGTDTYITQYGEVFTSAALFDITGSATTPGDVTITPASGKTIRIKVQEQSI